MSIRLGPFEVQHQIGEGAMGEVWRGVHTRQNFAVALKVVTGRLAGDPTYIESFHREVQAVAGLDHPGIVRVYDYGVVDAAAAAAAGDHFHAGSPWLAMELAPDGALDTQPPAQNWFALKRILLEILDALAHAHARGIVHRDLKPPNVLVTAGPGESVRLMLSDFGIAHIADPRHSSQTADVRAISAGTPLYMAPEQIHGQWRDYGAWTDLYALGCMAFELASGQPPFTGASLIAIAMQHVSAPIPPLVPRIAVPAGFERWLSRMLAKDPFDRYRCAADAAWALESLDASQMLTPARTHSPFAGDPAASVAMTLPVMEGSGLDGSGLDGSGLDGNVRGAGAHAAFMPTLSFIADATLLLPDDLVAERVRDDALRRLEADGPAFGDAPPLARRWQQPGDTGPTLPGAGQGLFGLREVPFVDRVDERERIWQALARVHQSGRARTVVIEGRSGYGKTRLARWIAERAAELGGATVLTATHSPIMGAADGMPRMLQTHLTGLGLDRSRLYERVRQWLVRHSGGPGRAEANAGDARALDVLGALVGARITGAHAARRGGERQGGERGAAPLRDGEQRDMAAAALVELMMPAYLESSLDARVPRVDLESPRARHGAIEDFLACLCRARPVILLFDDAQWGHDCLDFAHYLLEAQAERPLPVLILVTARSAPGGEWLSESEKLVMLRERPETEYIDLPPLPQEDHGRLVRQLLGLEDALAARVQEHTSGNPLFAVQLVGDWIERGALVPSSAGYRLRDDVADAFPADPWQLSHLRIERALANLDRADAARLALEAAAAIGLDVDRQEWAEICRELGLEAVEDALLEELVYSGVARRRHDGWSFTLSVYREAVERASIENGRWARIHLACARRVTRTTNNGTCLFERRGRHYLAAGEFDRACQNLWHAIERRLTTSAYHQAFALTELYDRTVATLGLDPNDMRVLQSQLARADVLRFTGDLGGARLLVERLSKRESLLPLNVRANLHRIAGALANTGGDDAGGARAFGRALELFERDGDVRGTLRCLHGLGWHRLNVNDPPGAIAFFEPGARRAAQAGEVLEEAWCMQGLAEAYALEGDARAAATAARARELFASVGCRSGIGLTARVEGDIALLGGDVARARLMYTEGLVHGQSVGHIIEALCHVMLAYCDILEGQFAAARLHAETVVERFTGRVFPIFQAAPHVVLLVCYAEAREFALWDACFERVLRDVVFSRRTATVYGFLAELSGDLLLMHEARERAVQAYRFAAAAHATRTADEHAARVANKLAALTAPA